MLRLGIVCVVACAPAREAMVANHSAEPVHGEVWFPRTDHDSDAPLDRVDVSLTVDTVTASLAGIAFSYDTGRLAPLALPRASDDIDGTASYSATVRQPPTGEGEYQLAIVLPALRLRAVRIAPSDAAMLDELRGENIARVTAVRAYGLDLDDDGRADLAVVRACIEFLDDGMCEGYNEALARRFRERWTAAPMCDRTVACASF